MSVKALRRIADNKKTKNPALDLSQCRLTALPPELSDCVWLTELNLSWNRELHNLSALSGLINLQIFSCSHTSIADLSPLAALTNLQQLDCYDTQIADLSPLADLVNLQLLICSGTQIVDLSPLTTLVNLQRFSCFSTQVADLSPLADLINLQHLYCSGTQVTDLSPLAVLVNLRQLDCSYTPVIDLSPILHWIQEDIPVIWGRNYSESQFIHVRDCPLICPPVEIARDSPQAVRDYFEELGADGRRLNEVKVIFLGEASAGKTSLVKRLLGEPFDAKESQTHGIRIRKAPFSMDDGDQVTAHLWDFGGQEVMHATHQFFCRSAASMCCCSTAATTIRPKNGLNMPTVSAATRRCWWC
jgi:internalin A